MPATIKEQKTMKLTGMGREPPIGEKVTFQFNKWSDKQAYLLNKDGEIWLSFEMDRSERLAVLQILIKRWIEEV